uniref:Uncharacterized protein n=1 Tax=Tanacetum cinerariifolium TaxID=118510 RepID=A0A6L2P5K4_TANCI|nr:hypothetical protein [Tanacetum cinerariifolium]
MAKTINEEAQIHAWRDGKEISITESSVRRDFRLAVEEDPKRKNTQVPQPSGSTEHVVNEAVYKELDSRLVRAAITASSLEAEQEIGNIYKTQSKETTDEASSPGTTSGGGPRFQDTIGIQLLKLVEDTNTTKLIVDAAHVSAAGEVNAASIATAVNVAATITTEEITLPQALKDQIRLDEEAALKLQVELQAEFNKEERIAREKAQKEQEANIALIEE